MRIQRPYRDIYNINNIITKKKKTIQYEKINIFLPLARLLRTSKRIRAHRGIYDVVMCANVFRNALYLVWTFSSISYLRKRISYGRKNLNFVAMEFHYTTNLQFVNRSIDEVFPRSRVQWWKTTAFRGYKWRSLQLCRGK